MVVRGGGAYICGWAITLPARPNCRLDLVITQQRGKTPVKVQTRLQQG